MMRTVPSIPALLLLGTLGCGSIEPLAEDVPDGIADDGGVEAHADADARESGREDAGAETTPGACLEGIDLELSGDPPRVWVCSVPEDARMTVCPDRWFVNAVDCGPLGGMFGFYRIGPAAFEFRSYGAVRASHGTITDFGQTVTGLPPGIRIEVYFVDGRYLWFQFAMDGVALHGYTMVPPG